MRSTVGRKGKNEYTVASTCYQALSTALNGGYLSQDCMEQLGKTFYGLAVLHP